MRLAVFVMLATLATVSALPQRDTQRICYDGVGCFSSNDVLTVLPDSPEHVNTQFLLYTRSNLNQSVTINATMDQATKESLLMSSPFSPQKATRVVIHGFRNSGMIEWVQTMKNEILKKGDFNVIVVNWKDGAFQFVNRAAANVFLVAAQLAHFLDLMTSKQFQLSQTYLIGHSFGAQVSGNTGSRVNGTISRITGLDPAEPFFTNFDNSLRLDKSDADFVEVIHSDAEPFAGLVGFGLFTALAHADFYPNGGIDQPGCSDGLIQGIGGFLSGDENQGLGCSHHRAISFFIESINHDSCRFSAHPCSSWDEYRMGNCVTCPSYGCPIMGYDTTTAARGKFFLATDAAKPYCGFEYRIELNLTDGVDENSYGRFYIALQGEHNSEETELSRDNVHYHGGNNETQMIAFHTHVGTVTGVSLRFQPSGWGMDKTVFVNKVSVTDMTTGHSVQFCLGDFELLNNQIHTFTSQTGC